MIHLFIKKAMLFVVTINICLDIEISIALYHLYETKDYVVAKLYKENNKMHTKLE